MNLIDAPQNQFGATEARVADLFELPLVSVIVVNYNYGALLGQAVASVYNQTYPRIECIVVDNASTDESPAVLQALEAAHSDLKVIRRGSNAGQTVASLEGFATAKGRYIVFLDADDALLPHCVEAHIHVHLSLRVHVGFTAGDMLQVVKSDAVLSTGEAMNGYILRGKGRRPGLLRPFRNRANDWQFTHFGDDLDDKVHFVPPVATLWVWSATSGLCFRSDALALFVDNEGLQNLWSGTDAYFAQGVSGWCGSALIDEPVFVYRLHGSNIFSQRAQLNRTLSYHTIKGGDAVAKAQALVVDQFVSRSARFAHNFDTRMIIIGLLYRLNGRETDPTLPRWAKRSSVAHRIYMHFDSFAGHFGAWTTRALMVFFGVPLLLTLRARRKKVPSARDE